MSDNEKTPNTHVTGFKTIIKVPVSEPCARFIQKYQNPNKSIGNRRAGQHREFSNICAVFFKAMAPWYKKKVPQCLKNRPWQVVWPSTKYYGWPKGAKKTGKGICFVKLGEDEELNGENV